MTALPVTAIVLAAGQGKRFGSDKRLAKLANGETVLFASLSKLCGLVDKIVVAIGEQEPSYELLPKTINATSINYVASRNYGLGMGCTLSDACQMTPNSHLLIVLADMPYIQRETIAQVITAFRESRVANPIAFPILRYVDGDTMRGHPVLFHAVYHNELCVLHGDRGAGVIVEQYSQHHAAVETSDKGVIYDIDKPPDILSYSATEQ